MSTTGLGVRPTVYEGSLVSDWSTRHASARISKAAKRGKSF